MAMSPWIALFLAVPAIWAPATRRLGAGLLLAALGLAYAGGLLGPAALPAFAALAAAAWAVAPPRPYACRLAGHVLFVALALGLSLHWLPGFHNPRVIGPERLAPDAVPFTMYLNLDKPLTGFWLILALPWVQAAQPAGRAARAAIAAWLATTACCLVPAFGLGLTGWAPKWPDQALLWAVNNLLLVCFAEEALFRGYVQGGLTRLLGARAGQGGLPLAVAALLFGAAHAAGGWPWVLLASMAGVGYGLAYRHGGLYAAILAHFGLNAAHFFLFTYPMRDIAGLGADRAWMDGLNYFIGFAYN
ncbi:CPBP family intramembrane glutamic endopeptidase [Bordetella bronchialis]|uniref:CPBP family intramembrane glutamic endopeptidase n=1 Tax=Bordetella bronchialis TaxID=463025 RepID=UPI003D08431E